MDPKYELLSECIICLEANDTNNSLIHLNTYPQQCECDSLIHAKCLNNWYNCKSLIKASFRIHTFLVRFCSEIFYL